MDAVFDLLDCGHWHFGQVLDVRAPVRVFLDVQRFWFSRCLGLRLRVADGRQQVVDLLVVDLQIRELVFCLNMALLTQECFEGHNSQSFLGVVLLLLSCLSPLPLPLPSFLLFTLVSWWSKYGMSLATASDAIGENGQILVGNEKVGEMGLDESLEDVGVGVVLEDVVEGVLAVLAAVSVPLVRVLDD